MLHFDPASLYSSRESKRNLKTRIKAWLARKLISLLKYEANHLKLTLRASSIWGPPERIHLGANVELQDALLNTVCGHIHFGDYAFCGHGCMFLTGTHDYQQIDLARQQTTQTENSRDIRIGRGVWLASGVIVTGNVEIADHSVICAGAVVVKSCTVTGVYAGVPAKLVRPLPSLANAHAN